MLFAGVVFASLESTLFQRLFTELFDKKPVYVYTSAKYEKILEPSVNIIIVKSCKKADIQFGIVDRNCSKPVFVLDYYVYKKNPNILGAFYWRKGRPQLRLRRKIIEKYHLHICKDFEDYVE